MLLIAPYRKQIAALCIKHQVSFLAVFGSVAKGTMTATSDVDMVVRFHNVALDDYFSNYMSLKEELEKLLERKVDLVEDVAVKNPIFRKILDRDMKTVYERTAA